MKKTVEEYLALPYTIELTADDGSYFIKVKELDGCMSVGSSKIDALAMIEDAMREWLVVAVEQGIDIPLPEDLQEDRYSGKFPLRMPKSLHRRLSLAAELDKVSLNQYLVMLLSETHALHQVKKILAMAENHPVPVRTAEAILALREEEPSALWQSGTPADGLKVKQTHEPKKTKKGGA